MGKDSVSMPMASAGIIGMSSDMKLGGFEVDPKILVIAITLMVVIVVTAGHFFR